MRFANVRPTWGSCGDNVTIEGGSTEWGTGILPVLFALAGGAPAPPRQKEPVVGGRIRLTALAKRLL